MIERVQFSGLALRSLDTAIRIVFSEDELQVSQLSSFKSLQTIFLNLLVCFRDAPLSTFEQPAICR